MDAEEWDQTTHHRYPPDEAENPLLITLRWKVVDGRLEVMAAELRSREPLTDATVRQVRWGAVFREARDFQLRGAKTRASDSFIASVAEAGHDAEAFREAADAQVRALQSPGRRRIYDTDHWDEVAKVYREAWSFNDPAPTRAVQEHFASKWRAKVSRNQAGKWVSKCRELGLLPPTEKRKPKA